ncbi:acetyltransferase [Chloroflexota bacterium]
MTSVVILGAGGLAREVLWIFREVNKCKPQWDILGFIDENPANHGKSLCDLPVLGDFSWFRNVNPQSVKVICGIGNNKTREKIVEKAKSLNLEFCSIIEPSVKMSSYVEHGEGVVIASGNVITTQVRFGNHVFVNLANTIGHDTILYDFVNLAPGNNVSGNVTLEEGVYLGTGCAVKQQITIGKWSTVGAGSVVLNDIPPHSIAVGVPAKVIKTKAH